MSEHPDHTLAWMKLDEWINRALEMGAFDLFLIPGHKPTCRVGGELKVVEDVVLDRSQTRWVGVCCAEREIDYMNQGYISTLRPIDENRYAELVFARTGGNVSVTLKFRGGKIPTFEETNVPPTVTRLLSAPNGLIIMAGPHASGKTTTLYMLVQWLNENRAMHICTVEKPRHFLLKPARSMIQQREVGRDCPTAASAIDAAMHQDLDAIMVGEVADFDTLAGVLNAAETGHLVLIQMHANDAREAIERLVNAAPEGMQAQVKRQLAQNLRGVIVQRLASTLPKGRVAVCDVLGEGARKLVNGDRLDAGAHLTRVQDEIAKLESARKINAEEAARLLREVGA
ncbi:MAG: Flp pilus assembly complex ATPase component TadA [Planctomycetes bacterium]|nr:Flp pilus assembly complex ATPase component TadA [Planctomycetota bacterium]